MPPKVAVMLCVPPQKAAPEAGRNVAVWAEPTVPVPNRLVPSKKLTVPAVGPVPPAMVAVKVGRPFSVVGLPLDVTVVVVAVPVPTVTATAVLAAVV